MCLLTPVQRSLMFWDLVLAIFFKIFFFIWMTFKVFIEFVTILLLSYVLVFWPQSMWGLSSLTRDRTCVHPTMEGTGLTTGPPGKSLVLAIFA